jgi:hypothetical protein
MNQTITRLFDNFSDAEEAVRVLERLGVSHNDISLVSHHAGDAHGAPSGVKVREPHDRTAGEAAAADAGAGAATGGVVGAVGGVLAGLGILAIPGLGPVVAAGWLASAAVGAVAGGAVLGAVGGLVGALTNAGVSKAEAAVYAEGVRRGGTLVSAKVSDSQFGAAEAALSAIPHVDIATRETAYRDAGWRDFDADAPSYTEDEILAERQRYTIR